MEGLCIYLLLKKLGAFSRWCRSLLNLFLFRSCKKLCEVSNGASDIIKLVVTTSFMENLVCYSKIACWELRIKQELRIKDRVYRDCISRIAYEKRVSKTAHQVLHTKNRVFRVAYNCMRRMRTSRNAYWEMHIESCLARSKSDDVLFLDCIISIICIKIQGLDMCV